MDIDWVRFDQDYPRRKVVLPTYPWQRQRYWMDKPSPRLGYQNNSNTHPLLGRRVKSAAFKNNEIQYESDLSATFPSYLTDHRVYEHAILPATAYLEMVLKAGTNLLKTDQIDRVNAARIDHFNVVQVTRGQIKVFTYFLGNNQ